MLKEAMTMSLLMTGLTLGGLALIDPQARAEDTEPGDSRAIPAPSAHPATAVATPSADTTGAGGAGQPSEAGTGGKHHGKKRHKGEGGTSGSPRSDTM